MENDNIFFFAIPDEHRDNIFYLFEKYDKQLFYYKCKIIGTPKLEEDALQESFYIISKNHEKIRGLDSDETRSYLYMIVKTTSFKIYKRDKKLHKNVEFDDSLLNPRAIGQSRFKRKIYGLLVTKRAVR